MAELIKSQAYADWIDGLKDEKGRARILAKVRAFEKTGHAGDTKALGDNVHEMRFDFGPGYRVYYAVFAETVVLLGGDKSTQAKDIKMAKHYAQIWKARYQK